MFLLPRKRGGDRSPGKFCSLVCRSAAKRVHEDRSAKHRAEKAARRRLERMGGVKIDRQAIFERDKWTCYICLRVTDPTKDRTRHPRAPTLDHAIPLALGGTHTPDNLVCACRGCNTLKGANPWHEVIL